MKTSSLTVVVATLGPGASNSEFPNFFQFWNKCQTLQDIYLNSKSCSSNKWNTPDFFQFENKPSFWQPLLRLSSSQSWRSEQSKQKGVIYIEYFRRCICLLLEYTNCYNTTKQQHWICCQPEIVSYNLQNAVCRWRLISKTKYLLILVVCSRK